MTISKNIGGDRAAASDAAGVAAKKIASNGTDASPPPRATKPSTGGRPGTAANVETAKQKPKLVRDSFTIPKSEYAVLDALKLRAARLMRPTKKSEVLRAGIAALDAMSDKAFLNVINGVPSLKTGRPKSTPPAPAPKTPTK